MVFILSLGWESPAFTFFRASFSMANLLYFSLLITIVYGVPYHDYHSHHRINRQQLPQVRDWRHVLRLSSLSTPTPLNPSYLRPSSHSRNYTQHASRSRFSPVTSRTDHTLHDGPNRRKDLSLEEGTSHDDDSQLDEDDHALSWSNFLTDASPPQSFLGPRRSLAGAGLRKDSKMSSPELRTRISEHRVRLARIKQQLKDVHHEKGFLEKALELKKGQRTMQDGQVKLGQAELADKEKEIAMYRREAPRTLQRYNELVRKQRELQETLNNLHQQSENLLSSKKLIMDKIQNLNVADIIERHARALPDAMGGALRKSAAVLAPFFGYLVVAADTNNRLVDKVGIQIDKYTHVNVSGSPFMSGILYYCVLLIPLLTLCAFIRRVLDTSSKLTVSHFLILGNAYFVVMCTINVCIAQFIEYDPMEVYFLKFERTFIVANLFLAIYYVWHIAMLSLQAALTLERRNVAQLFATLTVGVHYFIFTWRNIFTDRPPAMFTFNYLMYSTIFVIILQDRYRRLTPRQLLDVPLFHSIHLLLNPSEGKENRTVASTLTGLSSVLWRFCMPTSSPRRHIRRQQLPTPDRLARDARTVGKNRISHTHSKPAYSSSSVSDDTESSDDSEDTSPPPRRLDVQKPVQRKPKQRQRKPHRKTEKRGVWEMVFGPRKPAVLSSDSEVEPENDKGGGWRRMHSGKTATARASHARGARATQPLRSTNQNKGGKAAWSIQSLWRWSWIPGHNDMEGNRNFIQDWSDRGETVSK